jgi:hypothetical protein
MKLRILFSGLQVFAPRPASGTEPDTMHVVMPKSVGHHGDERHLPMLAFDAAHLVPNSPGATRSTVLCPLTNTVLTVGTIGVSLARCPEIVDLRPVTGRPIDPDVLDGDARVRAVARVELRSGAMTRVLRGACWVWEHDTPRPMSNVAEWVVDGLDSAAPLPLALRGWHGAAANVLPTLHPLGTGSAAVIDLQVLNVPAADLPLPPEVHHAPPVGAESPHFGSYYGLYDTRVPEWRPRFHSSVEDCGISMPGACPVLPPPQGFSPYTCMLAGDG